MLLRTTLNHLRTQQLRPQFFRPLLLTSTPLHYFSTLAQTRILVKNLPTHWDKNEIASRFSAVGSIQTVNLIKNNMGSNTGKAVI